jgi:hypothetical protein
MSLTLNHDQIDRAAEALVGARGERRLRNQRGADDRQHLRATRGARRLRADLFQGDPAASTGIVKPDGAVTTSRTAQRSTCSVASPIEGVIRVARH